MNTSCLHPAGIMLFDLSHSSPLHQSLSTSNKQSQGQFVAFTAPETLAKVVSVHYVGTLGASSADVIEPMTIQIDSTIYQLQGIR